MIGREDDDQFGIVRADEVARASECRLDVVKEILRWSRKIQ